MRTALLGAFIGLLAIAAATVPAYVTAAPHHERPDGPITYTVTI
jgi:hypothetical protein